jgi:restriction system protein
MSVIWGLHNDHQELDLIANEFVSVGWDDIGDLRELGDDKEALKDRLVANRPQAKPGAIRVWAGVLLRFAFEMKPGDLVIYPFKADSTLNFAEVAGDYFYDAGAPVHRNRRRVRWLRTGVPRAEFSKTARYEVGSAVTLFRVKNHADEFRRFVDSGFAHSAEPAPIALDAVPVEEAAENAEDEPSAERIETYTRDFVIDTLRALDGHEFEHFVADLLAAMGYRTRVTPPSGDGGVDVIAHRDPLGLEPPIVKVQCKCSIASVGGPVVQSLTGTLAPGGAELGLFVTLGPYARDAIHIERTRQDLRLIGGTELVALIFDHYESLGPEWKRLLPLRRVHVVDREPEAD